MRTELCTCGEAKTWKFIYTPSVTLPKGTRLKFDIQTKGRDIDWEIPSTNLKKTGGIIYGLLAKGKIVQAEEIDVPDQFAPQYEFILPTPLEAGESFTIVMGAGRSRREKIGSAHPSSDNSPAPPFLFTLHRHFRKGSNRRT